MFQNSWIIPLLPAAPSLGVLLRSARLIKRKVKNANGDPDDAFKGEL
jgi:hypothetical protein